MLSPIISFMGISFNIYALILVFFFSMFFIAYYRAAKRKDLNWTDMITHNGDIVSFSKILQIVGGVVGTWIVVQMTLTGGLTWDLFAIYLAYVASVDGFSKFITARYANKSNGGFDDYYPRQRSSYSRRDEFDEDVRPPGSAKTPGAD